MTRRSFILLGATLALGACESITSAGFAPGAGYRAGPTALGAVPSGPGGPPGTGGRVALLAPMTGPRAEIGAALRNAATLALSAPGSPALDVHDTGGTPEGAANAARAAIAAGDQIIIGPLTAAETAAAAPITTSARIPVLAFTNDASVARPGVWTLGITPAEQVDRLLRLSAAQGRPRVAALLPETDFGRAMGEALRAVTAANGAPPPRITTYGRGMASITAAMRNVSDYDSRRGPLQARIRAARALETTEGRQQAAELAKEGVPPAPFDALLLADVGEPLSEIAPLLAYDDVPTGPGRILGPALWALPGSGSGQFPGAWYAAPDPAFRSAFDTNYSIKHGTPAPPVSDLAYDAASIARVLAVAPPGAAPPALTQPQGFLGADGLIVLGSDGGVRRGLAVFQVGRGGPTIVDPAPGAPAAPVPGA